MVEEDEEEEEEEETKMFLLATFKHSGQTVQVRSFSLRSLIVPSLTMRWEGFKVIC